MTQRDHTVIATILAIIGLYFIGLTSLEIQPWDEGLYAVRGEGIVLYGNAWDQTPHALGGLYSSTAPPMTSWGVAAGVSLFGRTALGVRFFTLICSAIALFLLFHVMKKLSSYQAALASVVILGTSIHWLVYSRQAMTEVPLMMFTLLALWSTLQDFRKTWWIFSLALGGALMTKMAVSFTPLLFLVPLIKPTRHAPHATRHALLAALTGFALAAPWYVTMITTYGDQFWMAMAVPHISTAVEGNTGSLGPLYYVNQLLIAHPALILSFLFVVLAVIKRDLLPSWLSVRAMVMLWFVLGMIVFSVAATKNPHYMVMLLPPAVIVSVMGLVMVVEKLPRRYTAILFAFLIAASVWSVYPGIRSALRAPSQHGIQMALLGLLALMPIIAALLPSRVIDNVVVRGFKPFIIGVLAVSLVNAVRIPLMGRAEDIKGGRDVAMKLLEEADYWKRFVYLYHQQNAGDAMNPQLVWYTAGWMNGRDSSFTYTPLHMPEDREDIDVVATAAVSGRPWIVYYHPGKRVETVQSVTAGLAPMYDVELSGEHYSLFRLR